MFLSADTVEGNLQGMNPYAYVNGSPETHSDPSGRYRITTGGGIGNAPPPPTPQPQPPSCNFFCSLWNGARSFGSGVVHVAAKVGDFLTGASSIVSDVKTLFDPKASLWDKIRAGVDGVLNIGMDVLMVMGIGEALRAADLLLRGGIDVAEHLLETDAVDTSEHVVEDAVAGCEGLSFASATLVATSKGEQAIGTMRVGEQVLAYNPTTHKMELEPVLHVWINHDNDLVDLTLTATSKSTQHGKTEVTKTSETLHTNKKHPFLTEEKGFLPVGQITLGMHILEADGMYGVVTGWKVVPGVQVMYNLEVAQDHTYTVGNGQWVVHNCGGGGVDLNVEEARNGHTLGQHVNASEDDVFLRATVTRGADASAFYSEGSATQAIQYMIDNVAPRMEGTSRIFEGAFTRNIGYVVDRLGNRFETNFLRVVQIPFGPDWRILTAFPIL